MPDLKFVSFDPAIRNLGIVRGIVALEDMGIRISSMNLVQTQDDSGKKVRKSSDDLRRAMELHGAMVLAETWGEILIAEIPSGSQSARSSLGAGVMIGLLAARRKPLIQVSPAEAKKVAVGRSNATKDEMIEWAYGLYPSADWIKSIRSKRASKLTDENEHLADAIAIAHAGVRTPEFRTACALLTSSMSMH